MNNNQGRFWAVFGKIMLAALMIFGLGACATPKDDDGDERVSSLPWTRQEGWEGQGPLGVLQQQRPSNREYY
jgi:hypothetical protein